MRSRARSLDSLRVAVVAALMALSGCATPDERTTAPEGRSTSRAPATLPAANASMGACSDAQPRVEIVPRVASPGDRVRLRGRCFVSKYWSRLEPHEGYGVALIASVDDTGRPVERERDITCELIAHARHRFALDDRGHLRGSFEVPQDGVCFQQDEARPPVRSGKYGLLLGCHTCNVATLKIRR